MPRRIDIRWMYGLAACLLVSVLPEVGCTPPSASNCRTDADCAAGHVCATGGGLFVNPGGRCIAREVDDAGDPPVDDADDPPADARRDCGGSEETCDGSDDDCDGVVDESCPCAFTGASTGVCSDGTVGEDGMCNPPASYQATEAACGDGLDNDCDGAPDEMDDDCGCTSGEKRSCYNGPPATKGVGACTEGEQTCDEGTWDDCRGETRPTSEMCGNGLDNDCDGMVDEDCGCTDGNTKPCYTGPSGTAGTGICEEGMATCMAGQWGACQGETTPETKERCTTGRDEDCDGSVDEGCPCTYDPDERNSIDTDGSRSAGVCLDQTINAMGNCEVSGEADFARQESKACDDGADNDCDGMVDEAHAEPTEPCNTGCECTSGKCISHGFTGKLCDHCSDGKKNGGETDLDCGGIGCEGCETGEACNVAVDCKSKSCTNGTCD